MRQEAEARTKRSGGANAPVRRGPLWLIALTLVAFAAGCSRECVTPCRNHGGRGSHYDRTLYCQCNDGAFAPDHVSTPEECDTLCAADGGVRDNRERSREFCVCADSMHIGPNDSGWTEAEK